MRFASGEPAKRPPRAWECSGRGKVVELVHRIVRDTLMSFDWLIIDEGDRVIIVSRTSTTITQLAEARSRALAILRARPHPIPAA